MKRFVAYLCRFPIPSFTTVLSLSAILWSTLITPAYAIPAKEFTLGEVNNTEILAGSFRLWLQARQRQESSLSEQEGLKSVIENRVLAQAATKRIGQDGLLKTTKVGYPVQVLLEDELVATLRLAYGSAFDQFIARQHNGRLENLINIRPAPDLDKLKADTTLLNHNLSHEQEAFIKTLPIASVSLPNGAVSTLMLSELYHEQNIQGKIMLRNGNLDFLHSQAMMWLAKRYFLVWIVSNQLVLQSTIDGLRELIWDRHAANRLRQDFGLLQDIHDDNPKLDAAYRAVSQKEVDGYYARHKEKFRRIDAVMARHIRVSSQEAANQAIAFIQAGNDFATAVQNFSTADDKHNNPAGSLGTIAAESPKSWLKSAIFALPEGIVSRAFRSPQSESESGVYWEIVLVDKKVMGYHPAESETVRYLAGKEIAHQKLQDEYVQYRSQQLETARVSGFKH